LTKDPKAKAKPRPRAKPKPKKVSKAKGRPKAKAAASLKAKASPRAKTSPKVKARSGAKPGPKAKTAAETVGVPTAEGVRQVRVAPGAQPPVSGSVLPLLTLVAVGWILWQWITWPDVKDLVETNPETTAFIEMYRDGGSGPGSRTVDWRWVPYREISPNLKRAVIIAEDADFFSHHGFAGEAIRAAIAEAIERGEAPRGASTLTQQLAKNLWLSPTRNPLRKLSEAALTIHLEEVMSKRRLLEIYLNVVEFGVGIYGAEAAARHYFNKPASRLNRREAALLAASLPRPKSWHPGVDDDAYLKRARNIQTWTSQAGFLDGYL
jgi:monofunctional biosynthetic peptidoglycan transglycosylase